MKLLFVLVTLLVTVQATFLIVPNIITAFAQVSTACGIITVGKPPANEKIDPRCEGSGGGNIQKCTNNADKNRLVQQVLAQKGKKLVLVDSTMDGDIRNKLTCNAVALIASMLTLNIKKLQINSLVSDHAVDGGFHPKGQAMDLGYHVSNPGEGIAIYNFLYKKRIELNVIQIIWNNPPNQPGIDPNKECIGQSDNSGGPNTIGTIVNCNAFYSPGTMAGHSDHIHTAVHL